ncbi:hypothetical protein ACFE04_019605 [Oxalis oulophora]
MSETLSKSPQHPSHQNLPLVGRRLPLYEDHTTLNDEPCASRREDRVKPSPYPPEWNSYLLRLVEKGLVTLEEAVQSYDEFEAALPALPEPVILEERDRQNRGQSLLKN